MHSDSFSATDWEYVKKIPRIVRDLFSHAEKGLVGQRHVVDCMEAMEELETICAAHAAS